jgi:isochorismate synthase / 2-succinyl-5-enolpyruvyl-6-hydroxy-3-cyclohexene-1-carboxylate synthase / 2-succinyl-6-hydroxy-2,4-cyclohexadiene-1-carboxylate synthase / o-succinylbenzoate synthase
VQKALHPTPAVCGRPQASALSFLQKHEPFDRGFYAGPFGILSASSAEFVVGIRSALVLEPSGNPPTREMYLYAGVGIVPGSDIDSEWTELDLKVSQFRRILPAAPSFEAFPNDNATWAWLIVEELVRNGVTTFAVAPGSRSSPLTHAIFRHPGAQVTVCVDERSLAYWAAGHAMATGHPAAVVTTSGTAVANLLPAVVEASLSHVPLLLLTADRPAELRATGANQTIDQVKIFGAYVRHHVDVAPPESHTPGAVALTTVDAAVRHACNPTSPGPVHINLQLREPLAPISAPCSPTLIAHLNKWVNCRTPYTFSPLSLRLPDSQDRAFSAIFEALTSAHRGLIVAGELRDAADRAAVHMIMQHLQWPVVADILSGLRLGVQPNPPEGDPAIICHLDTLLTDSKLHSSLKPDCILQIGSRLVSKRVTELLVASSREASPWLQISERPQRHDEHHAVTHLLQMSASAFATALSEAQAPAQGPSVYGKHLATLDRAAAACLRAHVLQPPAHLPISEPAVAMVLAEHLPDTHGLFIGSSMPVRDLDMYAQPRGPRPHAGGSAVAANRGASGIDGVISTAAGFASGLRRPTTLLIGDLSFLHDSNGLLLLHDRPQNAPLTVILINNCGGGIFHFLPIHGAVDEGECQRLYTCDVYM